MTLRWSTLEPTSVAAWAELTNLVATVDRTEEFYDAEDLAEELDEPGFDPALDSLAVWDGDTMVGFAQLRVSMAPTPEGYGRAFISGAVHPDWRGRGIGTELLDRMEPRGRELVTRRHPGSPIQLRANGGLEGDPARALLADRGYEIVRYFTVMQRPLPGDPLPPPDPRVVAYSADLADATRAAHNDAFTTHWGSTAKTAEEWATMTSSRTFREGTSRVATDDGGTVLAYCLTAQWVERELYVNIVGTRQAARGQGLARAVLTATLAAGAATGEYDRVELDVDSVNPTGAGALYESVGFRAVRTTATLAKVEPPA